MTQTEAAEFCASHGMTLASIKNAEEQSISFSIGAGKTLNGNRKWIKNIKLNLTTKNNFLDNSCLSSVIKFKVFDIFFFTFTEGYNFWLSGTQVSEGTWLWNDGTPIQYNRWHQGWGPQPRNSSDHNCLFISPTYWAGSGWFDNTCNDALLPLCQKISIEYYGQGY